MRSGNIHIYALRIGLPVILAFVLGLTSCIKEGISIKNAGSDVLIQIKTRTDQPDEDDGYINLYHEDKIKELHVLFFTPDNHATDPYRFIEMVKAEQYGLNSDPLDPNPIYKVEIAPGTYHMVLIANCGAVLHEATVDQMGYEDGMYLQDLRAITYNAWPEESTLEDTDDAKWLTDQTSNGFRFMPMWGEKARVTVDQNGADMTGPSKLVPMIRMLAKIDVIFDNTDYVQGQGNKTFADLYDLHSVRFYNWHTTAQIIPNEQAVSFSYTSGKWGFGVSEPSVPQSPGTKNSTPITYKFSPAVIGFEDKLYTFETNGPDQANGEIYDPVQYPCIVLGISKKGEGGGTTRGGTDPGGDPSGPPLGGGDPNYDKLGIFYYRMDFIDDKGNYLDILRNHNYVFTVKNIINQGFPDPDQAHHGWVFDLDYKMEWDKGFEGSYGNGGAEGIHRLDISQTYFDFDNTFDDIVTITTTHPDGWSAYTSKYPDRIETAENLIVIEAFGYDAQSYYPAESGYGKILNLPANETFFLFFESWNPGKDVIVTEYIHIVSGNLTNVITVYIVGSDEN